MGANIPLGEYLRARRNTHHPEPGSHYRRRRVPGLRREELAESAGVSRDYYLRVEQGRVRRPSDQVLSALARALDLDNIATAYLFRLAISADAGPEPQEVTLSPDVADRLVMRRDDWPTFITDPNRDIVVSNVLATALGGAYLCPGANTATPLFGPQARGLIVNWDEAAQQVLASLRHDADPQGARLQQIVTELSQEPDFVRLWARHDVASPSDLDVTVRLGEIGDVTFTTQHLTIPGWPGYQLTIVYGRPGTFAEDVLDRLRTATRRMPARL